MILSMETERIKKVQQAIKEQNIDAFLVSASSNIFYLTGLKGLDIEKEFLMIIFQKDFKFISPRLYEVESKELIPKRNLKIVEERENLFSEAIKILNLVSSKEKRKFGFEKEDLKYSEYEIIEKNFKGTTLNPLSRLVEKLREIKSRDEILKIKKAVEIADKTFSKIIKIIKQGLTEKYIQRKIIEIMENFGAEGSLFEPIIASGKGSAMPHYKTSNKKIKNNEILLIDMGAKYKGYCSDVTRTVFVGRAPEKFKKLYRILLETQEMAIKECKEGMKVNALHSFAVSNLHKNNGLDKYFTHNLGHGVGIDIHESPIVSKDGKGLFKRGMVFTIEPGIYIKGWGGIRIEDLCLMGDKCEVLSKSTKKLIEIKSF